MHEQKRNKLLLIPMLIIANLYPLFGVLQHGWTLFSVVYIYWLEFLIITFFEGLRILFSAKDARISILAKIILWVKFILIRIFIFAFYLLFIVVFLGLGKMNTGEDKQLIDFAQTITLSSYYFRMALFQFFVYNLLDFIVKFFATGEYKKETAFDNYNFFDRRIIVVHLSIFIGAFIYTFFVDKLHFNAQNATLVCVSIFILVKIMPDIILSGTKQ